MNNKRRIGGTVKSDLSVTPVTVTHVKAAPNKIVKVATQFAAGYKPKVQRPWWKEVREFETEQWLHAVTRSEED